MFNLYKFAQEVFYRAMRPDEGKLSLNAEELTTISSQKEQNNWSDTKFVKALQRASEQYAEDLVEGNVPTEHLSTIDVELFDTVERIKAFGDDDLTDSVKDLIRGTLEDIIQTSSDFGNKIHVNGDIRAVPQIALNAINNALHGELNTPETQNTLNYLINERDTSVRKDRMIKITARAFQGALKEYWEKNPSQDPRVQASAALSRVGQDFKKL